MSPARLGRSGGDLEMSDLLILTVIRTLGVRLLRVPTGLSDGEMPDHVGHDERERAVYT